MMADTSRQLRIHKMMTSPIEGVPAQQMLRAPWYGGREDMIDFSNRRNGEARLSLPRPHQATLLD
jgi:hypothetical protein